jgi:hypothetical protein
MTRYYYTDPIQALWMMKEFGVKFDNACQKSLLKTLWIVLCLDKRVSLKEVPEINLYVAKESEHIFEPKDEDLGQIKTEGLRLFVKYMDHLEQWKEWHGGGYYTDKNGSDIIMRNNKHFFNPLIENNK